VDGSWTVDYVCDVNFDDGEEMLNCDDCGVWVHTRFFKVCSSVALAGFTLPACPGSSPRVYLAREGLTAVVHRGLVPPPLPGSTLSVHACHPRGALPAPGLAGCPVGRGE
jgi:hypothetical protein